MYIVQTKTLFVEATRGALDADNRIVDLRNAPVSIEYPLEKKDYPSIWLNFDPIGPLRPEGLGYWEVDGDNRKVARWSFAGRVEWTVVALTSLERDTLYDGITGMIAFGADEPTYGPFRSAVMSNTRINVTPRFDEIDQQGFNAAPGTPWGTDEVIYEGTVAIECVGEFVSSGLGDPLLTTSDIQVVQWTEGETPPAFL